MALRAGDRLGAYEIVGLVGTGGMGEVYRARDSRLGREVAIKVLSSASSADPDRIRRFEQEARAASRLSHPNIVAVHDIGTHDGAPYIVSELLEGQSLRERLRAGPLPVSKALDYALQTARALAHAHAKGVVHRDLKPENLFLTRDGRMKILDFGLAKLKHDPFPGGAGEATETTATAPGVILGTVGYMAPEQVRGQPADHRADVFSLGAIVHEMIAGRPTFRGGSDVETLNAILKEAPRPLDGAERRVPPALDSIVRHCLEKDPADRFQSAQDLAFDLELLSTPSGATALGPDARPAGFPPRRRLMAAAVGLGLGAVAAGVIAGRMLWVRDPSSSTPVRVYRLSEFAGLEEFPALSPDGKSVAFIADVAGKRQLWVRLVAGGPALQITRDPVDHLHPRWSRDGSSIVYFSPPPELEEAGSLWGVSALGGAPRRLARSLSGADLSRVDDRMAFFRLGTGKVELVGARHDGSDARVLAELETGYAYETPRWSPDGRSLAYERRTVGSDAIFVLITGATRPRQVIGISIDDVNGFSWLPDGSGLAFSSSQGSIMQYLRTFQLWALRLDDNRPKQLTFGEASYVHPDLDRTGALVASRVRMRSDLWRFPVDGDGAENVRRATAVTRQTAEVRTPSVSPDGREIVYISDVAGHSNLWVTRLEDGESRQLTFERDPSRRIGVPLWSPDGRQIAFFWVGERGDGYSMIQPDGSGLRQILTRGWWACWSPDGRWLYYQDQTSAPGRHLKKVPIEGGPPTVVRSENAAMPALSPDGKTLYFVVEVPRATGAIDYEVRSASPEDGPSRLLARIAAHRMPDAGRFHPVASPDGRWLATPLSDGVTTNIWAIATADGAMRPLTDFGHRPMFISRRVSWSPEGRSIYAAVSEGEADIVMLDGLVR